MNYDFFILRGHGGNDCGAVGNGYKEINIADSFVTRIVELLTNKGLKILTNTLSQDNYTTNVLKGHTFTYKCGCELHLNSGGGTGTEIIVPSKEKYLTLEKNLLNEICQKIGLNNRGLKSRNYDTEQFFFRENGTSQTFTDYYKVIRQSWEMGLSLSIIELGFIDNINDVNKLLSNKELICRIIANAYLTYCKKPLYSLEEQEKEQQGILYRVQVAAFSNKENAIKLQKELISKGYKAIIK